MHSKIATQKTVSISVWWNSTFSHAQFLFTTMCTVNCKDLIKPYRQTLTSQVGSVRWGSENDSSWLDPFLVVSLLQNFCLFCYWPQERCLCCHAPISEWALFLLHCSRKCTGRQVAPTYDGNMHIRAIKSHWLPCQLRWAWPGIFSEIKKGNKVCMKFPQF